MCLDLSFQTDAHMETASRPILGQTHCSQRACWPLRSRWLSWPPPNPLVSLLRQSQLSSSQSPAGNAWHTLCRSSSSGAMLINLLTIMCLGVDGFGTLIALGKAKTQGAPQLPGANALGPGLILHSLWGLAVGVVCCWFTSLLKPVCPIQGLASHSPQHGS